MCCKHEQNTPLEILSHLYLLANIVTGRYAEPEADKLTLYVVDTSFIGFIFFMIVWLYSS